MFRATDSFADQIVEAIHEPILVLGENLHIRWARPSFYRTFGVAEEEVVDYSHFELGEGQWAVSELRAALDRVIGEDESFEGLEVDRWFPGHGRKVMRLNGRTLVREGGEPHHALLAIEDVTEWRGSGRSSPSRS